MGSNVLVQSKQCFWSILCQIFDILIENEREIYKNLIPSLSSFKLIVRIYLTKFYSSQGTNSRRLRDRQSQNKISFSLQSLRHFMKLNEITNYRVQIQKKTLSLLRRLENLFIYLRKMLDYFSVFDQSFLYHPFFPHTFDHPQKTKKSPFPFYTLVSMSSIQVGTIAVIFKTYLILN